MTRAAADPVLTAVVTSAVEGTAARDGLLLAVAGPAFTVAAASGRGDVLGEPVSGGAGVAGYVVASGQPLTLTADSGDHRLGEGTATLLGYNPSSVLCVPCEREDRIVGALLLLDAASGAFTVDDTDRAMLLAGVAAAAIEHSGDALRSVPDPAELAGDLRRLADSDAERYTMVATIVGALLAHA
jgi:GAF domain-containing protein